MGKIIWFHGVTVKVKDKDHLPPHVHAIRGGSEARFDLNRMEWMDSTGFTRSDLAAIEEQIRIYLNECWDEWRRLHGED